jgi:acetolactate synthase-1/2/3 large subunit
MESPLDDGEVLMISSNTANAGGIAAFDGTVCGAVDGLRTQGLALRDGLFFRLLGYGQQPRPVVDLLVYDADGVLRYQRLDGVWGPHDVLPRDAHALVVATGDNTIYRVDESGRMSPWWRTAAQEDTWHLNCLAEVDGEVYVTAFGMFDARRDWDRDPSAATGVLLRMPDAEVVLSGLTQPHHPRWADGTWIVCNSGNGTLDAYDTAGRLVRRRELPRYPRGLAIGTRTIFVGSSTHRKIRTNRPRATVTMLDRADWSFVGAFDVVEWPEIYDLAIVPREILAGVANGFRTNAGRVQELDQLALFAAAGVQPRRLWAVGEPLPQASMRVALDASLPAAMRTREITRVPCRVSNRSDAMFITAPPNPIELCYRWYDAAGDPVGAGDWLHTPLGRALAPGETVATEFLVQAPAQPGRYTLGVTLLQENVAWFDDVDAANGLRAQVDVG